MINDAGESRIRGASFSNFYTSGIAIRRWSMTCGVVRCAALFIARMQFWRVHVRTFLSGVACANRELLLLYSCRDLRQEFTCMCAAARAHDALVRSVTM